MGAAGGAADQEESPLDAALLFLALYEYRSSANAQLAAKLLRDAGVFYRKYDGAEGKERAWPLAHVPLIIGEDEWGRISSGLKQRAELLELIVAAAIVGTGVALYPILKRQNEGVALGFLSARIIETGIIAVGIISLLAVVSLRQDAAAGTDAASLVATGQALVAIQKLTFLIGQGLLPGINGILLGYLFYRSGLVPRVLPAMGLIGGALMISSIVGQLFGVNEQLSTWSLVALVPVFLWELSLGLYLTFKGFKRPAVAALLASKPESADSVAVAQPRTIAVAEGVS